MIKYCLTVVMVLLLTACMDRDDLAPVVERTWEGGHANAKQHVVVRGDTLYSIAFHYDLDYRQLASYNRLGSPYLLRIGQVLRLKPSSSVAVMNRPSTSHARTPIHLMIREAPTSMRHANAKWSWPARGNVASRFAPSKGMKGIDIVGKQGDKIYAASSGVVAYAGRGLAGYGNLIIIKHGDQYLTAYGNNLRNTVREGQLVKQGQLIADMGKMDRRYWGVHFEIRQFGKPVDPLRYLS